MLVKCICTNCAGHLEFEEENAGEKIKCPHCAFETVLFLPGTDRVDQELARLARRMKLRRWLLRGTASVALLGAAGWCLYHWALPMIENWLPVESTPLAVAVLAGIVVAIPLLLAWLALPVVLFLQFRKLNELVTQIEFNLQPQPVQEEVEPALESRAEEITEDVLKL
jgi:DNA-directed RNA polymerase subunit RPC12/RpoP